MKLTDVILPDPGFFERFVFGARLLLRNRRTLQRESVSFHYDRPPEFFLPWFERWRSYSHGIYEQNDDDPADAQARKLQLALDRLGVKPGDRVFDMGCGWGSFVEYAGLQGIQVHAITISQEQHRFVQALIDEKKLPCRVAQVDFLDVKPEGQFDGAVFMGTFEHFPDYRFASRFLSQWLRPGARVWADFCTARGSRLGGAFLKKYVWPGNTQYVDVPKLILALDLEGFNIHELVDDTRSYACTVRDWAEAFDRVRPKLEEQFGREGTRAFQIFLRASEYFLNQNKTQAYHLVAGRLPAGFDSR
jgi:cyclopropane-fatty-acyl-phospholipid synthase